MLISYWWDDVPSIASLVARSVTFHTITIRRDRLARGSLSQLFVKSGGFHQSMVLKLYQPNSERGGMVFARVLRRPGDAPVVTQMVCESFEFPLRDRPCGGFSRRQPRPGSSTPDPSGPRPARMASDCRLPLTAMPFLPLGFTKQGNCTSALIRREGV